MTKGVLWRMAGALLIICIWVGFSGIARLSFQNPDHFYRNAIYETLVNYEWPIRNYEVHAANFPEGASATSLIYYIGFWLPSAVVGKVFGISAGYGFQAFWAVLGIALAYYLICAKRRQLAVWPLLILIFFSGLDIVGQYLQGADALVLFYDTHLEWWAGEYQYSSMTTQLFWVFNQAIPAWVCTAFMLVQEDSRSLVMILACCMLSATFPFVGLIPFALLWMFQLGGHRARGILTLQNVLGGGVIGIFSFLYLTANISSQKIMESGASGAAAGASGGFLGPLLKYLLFFFLEAGIYLVFLHRYHKRDGLYYAIWLSLLIIPPIKIGSGSDFCMRASIPALLLLALFVIDGLCRAKQQGDAAIFLGLAIALCIGGITPIHEWNRALQETAGRACSGEQVPEGAIGSVELLNLPNFSGGTDNSFFFRYIAD